MRIRSGSAWQPFNPRVSGAVIAFALLVVGLPPDGAWAQQAGSNYCQGVGAQSGLCSDSVFRPLNPFEQAAAAANQATFDALDQVCPSDPRCNVQMLAVYEAVREFVHTANALSGDPFAPTEFSLGLDLEGLGFALRWSAAEEMAAQGSITNRFAANQLSALAARLADIRWGARGLRAAVVSPGRNERTLLANTDPAVVLSSSDQLTIARWSGFVDAAFGWGDREDTTFSGGFENAFDFDGKELNVGTDYRVSNSLVVGAVFGYSDKDIDFDSSQSIVDARIESSGYSGQFFFLREGERAYMSGSLGYQWMEHDVRRRIAYPSNNPNVAATDSTALSSTDSSTLLASVGTGYQFRRGSLMAEPYVDLKYSDTRIDGFAERSFSNLPGHDPTAPDAFALSVGRQDVEALDSELGLRLQYVLTPRFGVLIPYLHAAYHRELLDDSRTISSAYPSAISVIELTGSGSLPGINFALPTDEPDKDYWTGILGFSVVLPNGVQGFLQILRVFDLDFYSESVVSGGLRYEF